MQGFKILWRNLFAVNLGALGPQPSPPHRTAMFHPVLSPQKSGIPMAHISGVHLTTAPQERGSALLLYINKPEIILQQNYHYYYY